MPDPQTLAKLVKSKYPGAYDDLSDADLEKQIKTKYPGIYDDIPTTQVASTPRGPAAGRGTGYDPANTSANIGMAVNALPAIGGALGAAVGAGTGPGAIGTAALGGTIGESAKQLLNRWRGAPAPNSASEAVTGLATSAALNAGAEGMGQAVGKVASAAAPWLMNQAIKPIVEKSAAGLAKAKAITDTFLKEGLTVTKSGADKLEGLLTATNAEIKDIIKNSTATVDPQAVASRTGDVEKKFATQVAPEADLTAVRGKRDEFLTQDKTTGPVTTMKPMPLIGSNGQPLVDASGKPIIRMQPVVTRQSVPISVQDAQAMKTGTYQVLRGKYGELGSAATETEKALARGLKEEIAAKEPAVSSLNKREGDLLNANEAMIRRLVLDGRRDPVSLSMFVARDPIAFVGALIQSSPAVKSMLAKGLYQSAARAAGVTPNILRGALAAIASSDEK